MRNVVLTIISSFLLSSAFADNSVHQQASEVQQQQNLNPCGDGYQMIKTVETTFNEFGHELNSFEINSSICTPVSNAAQW